MKKLVFLIILTTLCASYYAQNKKVKNQLDKETLVILPSKEDLTPEQVKSFINNLKILKGEKGREIILSMSREDSIKYMKIPELAKELKSITIKTLSDEMVKKLQQSDAAGSKGTMPVPLASQKPYYPELAIRAGIEGVVILELTINTSGEVIDVKLKKSDNEIFNVSAIEAAKKTKFKPALDEKGKPVQSTINYPVKYSLGKPGKKKDDE